MVVEIPAGTSDKWEVDPDGVMRWEIEDGLRRVVSYLPYPGNYGMVPGTLLSEEEGGDGDPLDVLVLGPAAPRGQVITARPVAVLRLLDDGETDDKLIAVALDGPLAEVDSLERLDAEFPGASAIVEIWFTHYKGAGRIQTRGYEGRAAAEQTVARAAAAHRAHNAR